MNELNGENEGRREKMKETNSKKKQEAIGRGKELKEERKNWKN